MLAQLILMHEDGLLLAKSSLDASSLLTTEKSSFDEEVSSEDSDDDYGLSVEILQQQQQAVRHPKRTVAQVWRRNFTSICVSVLKTIGHLLRANKKSRDGFKKVEIISIF